MPDLMVDPPPETRRLLPLNPAQPLALPASFPLLLAALEGRLYAAWADPAGTQAWLARLDDRGGQEGPAKTLPLSYIEDLGSLWMVAARPGDDRPRLLELDGQGAILWESLVPVDTGLTRWPRLACGGGGLALFWETDGQHPAVCQVRLKDQVWQDVVRVEVDSPSSDLVGVGDSTRVVLARASSGEGLQLIALSNNGPTLQAVLPGVRYPEHISLAAVGGRVAALWIAQPERSLQIQWFDEELIPMAPAQPLAVAGQGGQVSAAVLLSGGAGQLAVAVQTESLADAPLEPGGAAYAARPDRRLAQFIGPLGWKSGQVGPFLPVQPAGSSFFTGAWVDSRLVLVHGERQPFISFFGAELEARG